MNCIKTVFLSLFLTSCVANQNFAQVRVVLSAAITDAFFEFRKQQYNESLTILASFNCNNPYIIEALKKRGPTFLDDHSTNVFYSTANNNSLKNNGINEAKTLLDGLAHFNFDPDDMIIKITGRYHLISDYLLKMIETNLDSDAIVKIDSEGNLHTLGFAMKYKYMKEMYESINYDALEQHMISIEVACGKYLQRKMKQNNIKILYLDKLDIEANYYGSSNAHGADQIIIF